MAQLQVAQEEEHLKCFTDFCTGKYYGEGGARCMLVIKNFTEMGGVSVKLFRSSIRSIDCACTVIDS